MSSSDTFEEMGADEKSLSRKKEITRTAKEYKQTFEGKTGTNVLADLAKFSKFDQDAYSPGSFDNTAYVLGMQRIIKRIQSFLAMDDVHLLRIVKDYEVKINE